MIEKKKMFKSFPIIETEKFILRKLNTSDYNEIYNIYSDEEVLKYQCMKILTSHEEAKDYIQRIIDGYENQIFIRWAIADKCSDKVLGLIACHHLDYANKSAKLGYILNKEYWNCSIMGHCLRKTIDYLLRNTEISKLEVQIHPDNLASIKLAEKIGFIYSETLEGSALNPSTDMYEDRIIMTLLSK